MEGRLRLLSLDVELALEGGLGALRSDGNRLGGALVPDERFVSLADEETGLAYRVRRVGGGLQSLVPGRAAPGAGHPLLIGANERRLHAVRVVERHDL